MTRDRASLRAKKRAGQPISVLTCYDYPTALLEDAAGIDVVFVGDSVGTNVLGYRSPTEVTVEDMLHHLRAVRRGVRAAYLLVDLPHRSYDTPERALATASRFRDGGADGVKLEGGREQAAVVRTPVAHGFEVCGHSGFTPQTAGPQARVRGKTFARARRLVRDALALQEAGSCLLVLELVPEPVGRLITERLAIPTIGIGAGRFCDGQVQIVHDLLGVSPVHLRHVEEYAHLGPVAAQAIRAYQADVERRRFPTEAHVRAMAPEELAKLTAWARGR